MGAAVGAGLAAETLTVQPAACAIVVPAPSGTPADDDVIREAADELRKHVGLVTGLAVRLVTPDALPTGAFPLHVGIAPAGADTAFADQEARWRVTAKGVWFYGADRNAPLMAVYSFLNDQLGIDWIAPGDAGIVYASRLALILRPGDYAWTPRLMFRSIRAGNARPRKSMFTLSGDMQGFNDFVPTLEQHNAFAADVRQWQKRMRMGGTRPGGGHAFSDWWPKYGKTHPEYFALNTFGKREPVPLAKADQTEAFVKICPSNPQVAEQIVANWMPYTNRTRFINTGVNDGSEHFCECAACRALDAPLPGERPMTHLTDRYVHLSNRVAQDVRRHRSDACVALYAYLTTLQPPRRLRVESNIVVQLVPYVDPLDLTIVRRHFEGWRQAGATMIALRPNYHTKYLTTTLPLGIEKQMFDVFQLAVSNGAISADYDSLVNNWPVTGLSDFILAKAMADPSQAFDVWAEAYYRAFGEAAGEAQAYFEYWRREVWDGRLKPNLVKIANAGGAGDFARGLLWSLGDYYRLADFDATDAILARAAGRKLTPSELARVRQAQLANTHARLMFQAIAAKPQDKRDFAPALLAFRRRHKDDLPLQWPGVFACEIGNGDLSGLLIADQMKDYLAPWLQTERFWKFKLDPGNEGLRANWQQLSWEQLAGWLDFRTDRFWEQQVEFDEPHNLPEDVARVIFSYDGIAWYATRQAVPADWNTRAVFLRFGAVDESCWVYVNGQPAGEHMYRDKNDWKTPFEIRIDPFMDWKREHQTILVRVEDKGGSGGIWRPVWIVSKPR